MSANLLSFLQNMQQLFVQKVVEFTRPANTTAYAAGDAVAPATGAITAASNATPVVVTSTAHGLVDDDRVTIASVGGNTNANGTWKVKRITADTFSIFNESTSAARAGNAAYTSGGTFQKLLRFADVLDIAGGTGKIRGFRLVTDIATVTNGIFRLRLFNSAITQIADNAAFTELYANRAKEIADVVFTIVITEGSGSDASVITFVPTQPIPFKCAAGRKDIFIQITATAAFTPGSGENFRLEAIIERDGLQGTF